DVLSQLLHGTRTSLVVAGVVTVASTTLSWLVGLAAGYYRRAEGPLMAVTDLLLALPAIPLYVLVLTLLEPTRRNLIAVLALLSWPAFARIVRSVVLEARSTVYVEAASALGATPRHIVWRHLLPATLGILPTKLVLTTRFAVFAEATLAFLGLGSTDALSWGRMLNAAFSDPLLFARPEWPWLVLPPTTAIVALLVATAWVSNRPGP
ncbi:MAG: ABC transporter permease, partial [Vicinamibacterales bacterium]